MEDDGKDGAGGSGRGRPERRWPDMGEPSDGVAGADEEVAAGGAGGRRCVSQEDFSERERGEMRELCAGMYSYG